MHWDINKQNTASTYKLSITFTYYNTVLTLHNAIRYHATLLREAALWVTPWPPICLSHADHLLEHGRSNWQESLATSRVTGRASLRSKIQGQMPKSFFGAIIAKCINSHKIKIRMTLIPCSKFRQQLGNSVDCANTLYLVTLQCVTMKQTWRTTHHVFVLRQTTICLCCWLWCKDVLHSLRKKYIFQYYAFPVQLL